MKTIGQIFREKREEKKLTWEEVEKAIKIRKKFLAALEKGEYDKLPQATFTRGFVKNYSEFLGLSANEMLALYRREYDERKVESLLPEGVTKPFEEELVLITPKRLTIFFVFLLLAGFFFYLFSEYRQLAGAPMLMVVSPQENTTTSQKEISVVGKTDPDATIKINNEQVTFKNGSFIQTISLSEGLNTITILATGKRGKSVTIDRHVRLVSLEKIDH